MKSGLVILSFVLAVLAERRYVLNSNLKVSFDENSVYFSAIWDSQRILINVMRREAYFNDCLLTNNSLYINKTVDGRLRCVSVVFHPQTRGIVNLIQAGVPDPR